VLKRIEAVLEGVRWMGEGFVAKCPAHDDQKQSLKVDPRPDDPEGWPLMRCYAGCEFGAVREALEAKGVKCEKREPQREAGGKTTTRYEVRSPEGVLIATKVRVDPGKMIWWELPDGTRGLRSAGLNTDDLLYRVECLADNPGRAVVICEGEKAADALVRLGVKCALGTTGGANASLSRKALAPLRGREVFLWPDNDEPGRKHMAKIRAALAGIASAVYVIRWDDAPDKGDAADWVKGRTLDNFMALAQAATSEPAPEWSKPFAAAIREFMAEIDRRVNGTPSDAIPSGLRDLDDYIGGGFKPGEVYLWGAPTGGGKTTIMQSIAIEVAKRGQRVLLVSPEMTLVEIARRAVVREVQREMNVWRDEQAAQPFINAGARLTGLPIVLADKVDITMPEIVAEAMRLAREEAGLGLVIVDYAQQVVDDSDPRARYLQVGDVAEKAVLIAKTLRVPVLVASQVNKTIPEKAKDAKPVYTFRESAKLEHKASVVLIFDRRFAFDPDAERNADDDDERIDAKIVCHKNRLGAQFRRVEVRWNLPLFSVTDGPWDVGRIQADEAAPDAGLVVAGTPPPDLPDNRQGDLLLND
jgi:replicative DNA helicase